MAPLNLIQISDSPCLGHNFNTNLIYLSCPGDGREALLCWKNVPMRIHGEDFTTGLQVIVVHTNREINRHMFPILGILPMFVYLILVTVTFWMLKSVDKVNADVADV